MKNGLVRLSTDRPMVRLPRADSSARPHPPARTAAATTARSEPDRIGAPCGEGVGRHRRPRAPIVPDPPAPARERVSGLWHKSPTRGIRNWRPTGQPDEASGRKVCLPDYDVTGRAREGVE